MKDFFYKNWVLFYVVFFFLLGILIHALLWEPSCNNNQQIINDLNKQLNECQNNVPIIDTTSNKPTVVDCNATVKSGGQGKTTTIHSLGNTGGKVIVEYNMQTIPDQMTIYCNNEIVAESNGLVSGFGQISFDYTPKYGNANFCKVVVNAPQINTSWQYLVNCPQ